MIYYRTVNLTKDKSICPISNQVCKLDLREIDIHCYCHVLLLFVLSWSQFKKHFQAIRTL